MLAPWGRSLAYSSIRTVVAAQKASYTTCLLIQADGLISCGHLVSVPLMILEPISGEIAQEALAHLHSAMLPARFGIYLQLLGTIEQGMTVPLPLPMHVAARYMAGGVL